MQSFIYMFRITEELYILEESIYKKDKDDVFSTISYIIADFLTENEIAHTMDNTFIQMIVCKELSCI